MRVTLPLPAETLEIWLGIPSEREEIALCRRDFAVDVLAKEDYGGACWTDKSNCSAREKAAKTKVINSCLNPVWNEELIFYITEPIGVLNLEVFDKDRFKADDKMGQAHLSLQPIVSAARLRQVLQVSAGEETKIRKVIPDSDNCLVRDSSVSYVNGEVVQDVWLRLCGVESGEIELKIKWVDLPSAAPSR
ncbi:hypothetical protein HHK36_003408 [Tetracentron sinense]|uniref:C2 domain-containing protein n=1 Tax=Tetracentron sinense TaxID=13715 RepID=A0A834ZXL6_TETSI|nr:hypothetical protein HHK36_003408 [Tetracentron sinense]